ncbi:DUF5131 family protein [Yinghuangia aomiensis]
MSTRRPSYSYHPRSSTDSVSCHHRRLTPPDLPVLGLHLRQRKLQAPETQTNRIERRAPLRCEPALVQRRFLSLEPLLGPLPSLNLDGIGWVIVGGESGPRHRPMDPDWARAFRDQCAGAGVPFFYKQFGGHRPTDGGRLLDGRTWDEMPATTGTPFALHPTTTPTPEENR